MKKITFLFTFFILTLGFSQNGGNTCATAVTITPGSFINTSITEGISGGEQGTEGPVNAAWFSYTPEFDGTIDVSACGSSVDTRLYIGIGSCGSLSTIAESDDECDLSSELTGVAVTGGVTYYIEWDDRYDNSSFDWTLSFNSVSCVAPSGIIVNVQDTSANFSWNVPPFGTPIGYDWEIVPQGNAQGVGVVASGSTSDTSVNSGEVLLPETDYDFYVRTDCDTDGTSSYVGPISFTTYAVPPISNDLCSGAESVSQETSIPNATAATPIAATIENAFDTNYDIDCFSDTANFDLTKDDVWFAFTAQTADINITINTNEFFPVVTLFSGADCNSLTLIDCEFTDFGNEAQLSVNSLTVNETYYFRVYHESVTAPTDPTFTYKLWSSTTLSVENTDDIDTTFKYFPNPVKNTLQLNAQSNIQNVSIYNMLGQEVFTTNPNNVSSTVDMSGLQAGAYFVKVTINNRTENVRVIKQ